MNLPRNNPGNRSAFTVIELLASLAAAALLCCLILPVLARAKQSPQAAQCLSNHKQLMLAALMYADDNGGLWFPNQPSQHAWVTDNLSWTAGDPNNSNIGVLTSPTTDMFARYIKSPRIFHCPGDFSRAPGDIFSRIRSESANGAVGTMFTAASCYKAGDPVSGEWLTGSINDCDNTFRRYGKASDMIAPSPSRLWVFIDEHANSINDGTFAMQVVSTNIGANWVDLPASYHNGATGISFADGHVEMHSWVGASVSTWAIGWSGPNDFGGPAPLAKNLPDVLDIRWLQQRTSARAQ